MWCVGGNLVLTANVLVTPVLKEVQRHAELYSCFRSVSSERSQTHYAHHIYRSEEEEELCFQRGKIYKLKFGFLLLIITFIKTLRFHERHVYKLLSSHTAVSRFYRRLICSHSSVWSGSPLICEQPSICPSHPDGQTGSDLTGLCAASLFCVYWCPVSLQTAAAGAWEKHHQETIWSGTSCNHEEGVDAAVYMFYIKKGRVPDFLVFQNASSFCLLTLSSHFSLHLSTFLNVQLLHLL